MANKDIYIYDENHNLIEVLPKIQKVSEKYKISGPSITKSATTNCVVMSGKTRIKYYFEFREKQDKCFFEDTCDYCGKVFINSKQRKERNKHCYCSTECRDKGLKEEKNQINCTCGFCGIPLHRKPYTINKNEKIYCSNECKYNDLKIRYLGEGNHQFGVKGDLNNSWKSDERITNYGYKKIRVLDHPFRDSDDFVFEHRLVAEKYLLNDENSIEIDGKKYLKKEYIVHHKDQNRLNNNVENLQVLTHKEHAEIHHSAKENSSEKKKIKKQKPLIELICPVCGKHFSSTNPDRICCSVKCSNVLNNRGSTLVTCSECGKKFIVKNSRLKKSEHIFCSTDCYNKYRNEHWERDEKGRYTGS